VTVVLNANGSDSMSHVLAIIVILATASRMSKHAVSAFMRSCAGVVIGCIQHAANKKQSHVCALQSHVCALQSHESR
jgi:cytidine deaminase